MPPVCRTLYIKFQLQIMTWLRNIWPWNFVVKVNAEFKEKKSINLVAISVVIVAKIDSNYGINMCIGIYIFYFRLYFNLQITMKHSGH